MAANFRAAGARGLVVSGVVDPARGTTIEPLPHVDLTALRLRADQATLRERVAGADCLVAVGPVTPGAVAAYIAALAAATITLVRLTA